MPNGNGSYITFSSADGTNLCIKGVAFVATDISKSRTDQLLVVGTGDFSTAVETTKVTGIGYLDSKGTLKKDSMGSITSISLNGKIAGGIAGDSAFVFSGNFRSTLSPK